MAVPSRSEQQAQPPVLSVSELTAQIKDLLEAQFTSVWVSGEISNFSRPRSGHCYLTLKDDAAQLRAVIWRTTASRVPFDLEDGQNVLCQGHVDVYPPRGSYQLVIERIEPKGIGALDLALRQLRAKLADEGLFDAERKRPLPRYPRRIAVVTSPTGAAIRDFLEVLRRRWQGVDVWVVPVRVQGEGAAQEIADAIQLVNRCRQKVDCLVVTRGGGSLEDLWAFNEEVTVRAIHDSRIPVVSGVGHEIDVTLSDMVADVRAFTPSDAALRVVPSREEVGQLLHQQRTRLITALRRRAVDARSRLDALAAQRVFRKPLERIHEAGRRLDELAARALRAARHRNADARRSADRAAAQLESLSPKAVLARGYSLTQRTESGQLVLDAATLSVGDSVTTVLARGKAQSRVERVEPAKD